MTGFQVRAARAEEYDEIARITVAAYLADGQITEGHSYASVLADVQTRVKHGDVLVAVDGDRVLGSITFVLPGSMFAELSRPGEAEFRMLAVDPTAQGRGVGAALVRACQTRAAELGCSAVVLCTRDFSALAHRLYQRLGFAWRPELDWSPEPGVNLLAMRHELGSGGV